MAVSQYLRPESLLGEMRTHLTPGMVHSASSVIGESETATREALSSAVPSILAGVTRLTSSQDGATGLANMVREGGYDSLVSNPPALFSGGGTTSRLMGIGQQLLIRIFGAKASAVSDVVARSSGVSPNSANKLMSLVAPLTMGVLSRHLISQGLDAFGLSKFLSEQKDEISAAEPSGLSRILDSSGPAIVSSPTRDSLVDSEPSAYQKRRQEYPLSGYEPIEDRTRSGFGAKIPWLLLVMILLASIIFLRGRSVRHVADVATQHAANAGNAVGNTARSTEGALTGITLPGGVHITLPQGSTNYNLATYLGSSAPPPKTFVFDHLNFDSSANVMQDSVSTVNDLAAVLNAYPNSRVQLVGYTDNTGSPQDNRRLSQDRANVVKGMLVDRGVNSDRVAAVGLGENNPMASNDTEDGRAKNRRLELTVTTK